ncbi:hypothetical protein [Thermosulfurimonas dismutans]|uniref:PD-(D/E)XK endonuclease-like domain-containing protein n=1 Tax=Thermosulfurimonas dismutans TaxID=999894 RepID=A0A179D2U5_9BACT|nr:hypothetical protein [Thermosulfurimonas dismutans]OAQ20400.1 hypothetical protein TDIS_1444 [Thermosulfurimonas dismutans]
MRVRIFQQRRALKVLGEMDRERVLGEMAHLALYFLPAFSGVREEVEEAVRRALALYPEPLTERETYFRELTEILFSALSLPAARPFFSPGLRDLREHPFVTVGENGPEGHRPDRIVFLPEGPVVLEYKLSGPSTEHEKQVREYLRGLSAIWGSPVRGYLFYLRPPELREVPL